uniref:E74 like ETS transcription factor 3 n=1 Tax=Paramormyrops kingsleyae TaxID=1676925 RepID=A0A3B3RS96_9TELE
HGVSASGISHQPFSVSVSVSFPQSLSSHYTKNRRCLINPSGSPGTLRWYQLSPQHWTKQHVLEWISYHVEENQFDASSLNMTCCSMDGSMLCQLTYDMLLALFGSLGHRLYQSLQELKAKPGETPLASSMEIEYVFIFFCTFKLTCFLRSGILLIPSSPESGGSDSDPEFHDAQSSLPTGRCLQMTTAFPISRSPRGTHLWEFIRDILIHPELNHGLMKWEDRKEGVFKFLKSEAVAQLWGQKKRNSSMTYEKLSRAMRYYYKRGILERVDGRRLVYKFGKNSSGWNQSQKL